jgi:sporulation protein YlmC with PRC-barrel domain
MPYIGNDLQVAFPSYTSIDDISSGFNGVLKTFALRVSGSTPVPFPVNPQQCLISVNNVIQKPDPTGTTGFNLVGTNIVFATAPTAGWNFFGVILAGADYVSLGAKFPTGSASVPSITFEGDVDTGIYNIANNELGFTTGGVLKSSINSAGQYLALTGSASGPIYSFIGDTNTGLFSPGADQIGLATAGTARIQFASNGALGLNGANYGTSGQVLTSNGSGSAPTWQTITGSVTASGNNTFTGANIFQNATGQTFVSSLTTHDGILITGRGAGTSSYRVTVSTNTLSSNKTVYFPNQSGDILISGNASIVNADVSNSAAIAFSKLASLTAGNILLGNASNVATSTAVSGDITISNTGVTEIGAGVIVNADISNSASIAFSKLASLTAASVLLGNASNVATATALTGDVTINSSGVTAIGSGVIVDADINASAAIAFSKLASLTAGNILLGNASNVATVTAVSGDVTINSSGVTAIGSGVIVDADVNASAAIAFSKLASLTSGNILIGNGSNVATATAVTGDVTISNTGVTAIATGVIVNADINNSAGIEDTKLATITTAGKVSGTAITSGNIVTSGNIATTGTLAVGQSSAAANTELDLAGTYAQTVVAVAALNIDCSTGNYFTKTISANSTFTVSNVPSSRAYAFTLELTHTSGTVTWFSGVEWPGSVTPLLTTGKTHLFMFVTDDGGTRWRGSSLINYTN